MVPRLSDHRGNASQFLRLLLELIKDFVNVEPIDLQPFTDNAESECGHAFIGRTLEDSLVDEDSLEWLEAGLEENTEVEIGVRGGTLVVRPARKDWRLDELVAGITSSNIHGEISWGRRAGREVW